MAPQAAQRTPAVGAARVPVGARLEAVAVTAQRLQLVLWIVALANVYWVVLQAFGPPWQHLVVAAAASLAAWDLTR